MRTLLALLPWACVAGGDGGSASCRDLGECRSTGNSALLQQRTDRVKSSVPLSEEGAAGTLHDESSEVEEASPDDDAEYAREVAALQALQEGTSNAGGSVGTSRSATTCDICSKVAGPTELIPNRWAGKVDGILWKCRAADDFMGYLATLNGCPQAPRQWLRRCCKRLPTPAPTPPPQLSDVAGLCDLCPGSKCIWHNFAGKDKRGLYTCTRAHRFANSKAKGRPSCERAVGFWGKACCVDRQPKCSICPRGLRDLRPWAPAGRWTGGGGFDQKWINCKRAHALVQRSKGVCGRVRRPFVKKCCTSRR